MENITAQWEKLQLTEEEDVAIDIAEDAVEEATRKGDLSLIGMVWVD